MSLSEHDKKALDGLTAESLEQLFSQSEPLQEEYIHTGERLIEKGAQADELLEVIVGDQGVDLEGRQVIGEVTIKPKDEEYGSLVDLAEDLCLYFLNTLSAEHHPLDHVRLDAYNETESGTPQTYSFQVSYQPRPDTLCELEIEIEVEQVTLRPTEALSLTDNELNQLKKGLLDVCSRYFSDYFYDPQMPQGYKRPERATCLEDFQGLFMVAKYRASHGPRDILIVEHFDEPPNIKENRTISEDERPETKLARYFDLFELSRTESSRIRKAIGNNDYSSIQPLAEKLLRERYTRRHID